MKSWFLRPIACDENSYRFASELPTKPLVLDESRANLSEEADEPEHEEKRRHVIEKGAYSLDPSLPLTPLVPGLLRSLKDGTWRMYIDSRTIKKKKERLPLGQHGEDLGWC